MEHSKKFKLVKSYYGQRLWSIARIRNAVAKGWITASEYEEIVGEAY